MLIYKVQKLVCSVFLSLPMMHNVLYLIYEVMIMRDVIKSIVVEEFSRLTNNIESDFESNYRRKVSRI